VPVGAGTVYARQPRPGAVAEYVIIALAVFPALVIIRLRWSMRAAPRDR
jgi:hypothetical protein